MRLADALSGVRRVAIDAGALIDFVEQDPRTIAVVRPIFERFDDGRLLACGSTLLYSEVYVEGVEDSRRPMPGVAYGEALARLELAPVTAQIAQESAALRQIWNLDTIDALHFASALLTDCDAFLTGDEAFLRMGASVPTSGGRSLRVLYTRTLTR